MRPLACAQVQNDKENNYSSKNDKEENLSINNRTTTIPSRLQNNAPVKLMIIYSWSYSRFVLCLWVVICVTYCIQEHVPKNSTMLKVAFGLYLEPSEIAREGENSSRFLI